MTQVTGLRRRTLYPFCERDLFAISDELTLVSESEPSPRLERTETTDAQYCLIHHDQDLASIRVQTFYPSSKSIQGTILSPSCPFVPHLPREVLLCNSGADSLSIAA